MSTLHKNPELMYKVGYTDQRDILKRFTKLTAIQRKFKNVPLEDGYTGLALISRWMPMSAALQEEKIFAKIFKPNIVTDVKYNGITECRVLTPQQVNEYKAYLDAKYPTERHGKPKYQYVKIYLAQFTKIYETQYDDS
jgi:hypothetical protein